MQRPKLVVAVLAGGTLVLGVGSAVAASLPSWTTRAAHAAVSAPAVTRGSGSVRPLPVSPGPSHPGVPTSIARTAVQAAKAPVASSVTYTVKPGDTLSGIAEWFKLHGYGALYAANAAVIGSNPNLIFPGERITIAHGVMKVSSAP